MYTLLKFLILFLLASRNILSSALNAKSNNPNNGLTFELLNNATHTSLVPYYHSISSGIAYYENVTQAHFPLFHPCFNPFPNDDDKPLQIVDPAWLRWGEKSLSHFQAELKAMDFNKDEKKWLQSQTLPRFTFLWSFYQMAVRSPLESKNVQLGLKSLTAHSFIRYLGFQAHYQLQLERYYFDEGRWLATQLLEHFHILMLRGNDTGFIPLIVINPPAYLLGIKAENSQIPHFLEALTHEANTLIADPKHDRLFSPYHHPDFVNASALNLIGIFSGIAPWHFPEFVSSKLQAQIQKEIARFSEACQAFALSEERRFLDNFRKEMLSKPSPSLSLKMS